VCNATWSIDLIRNMDTFGFATAHGFTVAPRSSQQRLFHLRPSPSRFPFKHRSNKSASCTTPQGRNRSAKAEVKGLRVHQSGFQKRLRKRSCAAVEQQPITCKAVPRRLVPESGRHRTHAAYSGGSRVVCTQAVVERLTCSESCIRILPRARWNRSTWGDCTTGGIKWHDGIEQFPHRSSGRHRSPI
jgi:hypothetical protein